MSYDRIPTTRAQRLAMYQVYKRLPLKVVSKSMHSTLVFHRLRMAVEARPSEHAISYLQFRRLFSGPFHKSDAYVGVWWCGMYLGIEPDGYVHS